VLAQLLTDVKTASLAALAAGSRPAPDIAYVTEGDPAAYDCPNSLIVSLENVVGLTQSGQNAQSQFLAPLVTVVVELLRCAAPPGAETPPSPPDIETSGIGLLDDLSALLGTVLGDCRPLQLLSGTLPRSSGGDLAPIKVRWSVEP
jgi:hypothetical protein